MMMEKCLLIRSLSSLSRPPPGPKRNQNKNKHNALYDIMLKCKRENKKGGDHDALL